MDVRSQFGVRWWNWVRSIRWFNWVVQLGDEVWSCELVEGEVVRLSVGE